MTLTREVRILHTTVSLPICPKHKCQMLYMYYTVELYPIAMPNKSRLPEENAAHCWGTQQLLLSSPALEMQRKSDRQNVYNFLKHSRHVTPQNVIRIAAKCNTNTKCNNIDAKCNKIFNAECNNLFRDFLWFDFAKLGNFNIKETST